MSRLLSREVGEVGSRAVRPRPRGWLVAIAATIVLFELSALIAPLVPVDPTTSPEMALCAYAIAYGCVTGCALATSIVTPDLGRGAIGLALAAAIVLAVLGGSEPSLVRVTIVLACLLASGTGAGAAIGARIESAGHLLPVAIVSSIADALSVWTEGAPSETALSTPALLSVLAIAWPIAGTHDVLPILGVGDVVFVALYLAACRKHRLSIVRTLVALALGLVATASVVIVTATAIPALPLVGAAVVIAHPEARRVPEKDRRAAIVGVIVLIVIAALVALRARG